MYKLITKFLKVIKEHHVSLTMARCKFVIELILCLFIVKQSRASPKRLEIELSERLLPSFKGN